MMEFLTKEMVYQKSPQQLTTLLYEGIIENLEQAIEAIEEERFIETNIHLQKANDILHRLGVGLRYEAGPVTVQLDALYNFMASEIIQANLKKDISKIRPVLRMVEEIAGAWIEAQKKKDANINAHLTQKMTSYEKSIMRAEY